MRNEPLTLKWSPLKLPPHPHTPVMLCVSHTSSTFHLACIPTSFFRDMNRLSKDFKGFCLATEQTSNSYTLQYTLYRIYTHCYTDGRSSLCDKPFSKLLNNSKYWLNLPSVLMMSELLIHKFIKENEAWEMKHVISFWFIANTKVNLPAVQWRPNQFYKKII